MVPHAQSFSNPAVPHCRPSSQQGGDQDFRPISFGEENEPVVWRQSIMLIRDSDPIYVNSCTLTPLTIVKPLGLEFMLIREQ